jgi:phage-related protein
MTTALPLIRAYGTGTFTINGITVQITSASSYTDIDCDLQECFKDTLATNCNGNVVLTTFPELKPGENTISMSGITKLEITPRWWRL